MPTGLPAEGMAGRSNLQSSLPTLESLTHSPPISYAPVLYLFRLTSLSFLCGINEQIRKHIESKVNFPLLEMPAVRMGNRLYLLGFCGF